MSKRDKRSSVRQDLTALAGLPPLLFLMVGIICLAPVATAVSGACSSNPCQNGGVCGNSTMSGFNCTCPKPYSGSLCQFVTGVCNSSYAQYNVTCVNGACQT